MKRERPSGQRQRRTDRRDLLVVASACVAVFIVGFRLGLYAAIARWINNTLNLSPATLEAVFALAFGGAGVIAVLRWRQAARERGLRSAAEDDYRRLVEQVPAITYSWDPTVPTGTQKPLYVSPQVEEILGYTPREWMTSEQFWIDRVHPDDRGRVIAASDESDRRGTPFVLEYRMLAKDGRIVWLRDEATVILDRQGRPERAHGVMYDITDRKQVEQQLMDAESRYRTIVERVPAVAYVWDTSHEPGTAPASYISPQIQDLLGYSPAEWIDHPELWTARVHPEDLDDVLDAWRDATRSGRPFAADYRIYRKDGELLWIRDEAAPVAARTDGFAEYQGVMIDVTASKQSLAEAEIAERRYRELLEHLPVVAYMVEVTGESEPRILDRWVGPGIESLTGYTRQEWLTGADIWPRLAHPEDRDAIADAWLTAAADGRPFAYEYEVTARDGRAVWIRDEAVVVDRGDAIHVEGVFIDVTSRREAEASLEQAERRFRTLVERIPAVTYIEDAVSGDTVYISPQIEELFGFAPEEWLAQPGLWKERLHPDDREWVVHEDSRDSGDSWSIDYRALHRDGHTVWLHNDALLIRDESGVPLYWQGVAFDITERKEAEAHLRRTEERYRSLVEQLPSVVYIDAVDDLSTALYISPQYERVFGFSPEQRINDPGLWVRQIHPEDHDRIVEESDRTNRTGDPFDVEYRWVRADGTTIWVHDEAIQVAGADGARVWQGILTDITEQKTAREALERRDQILQAAGLAAERFLRAPAWTECVDEVLATVGEVDGASRAFVFRNDVLPDGRLAMTKVFEWNAPGVPATLTAEYNASYPYDDGYEDWEELLPQGMAIQGLAHQLPARQREWLEREGVRSSLAVPVFVGGEWWGFIGLDQCNEAREWQPAEMEALKVVASTLGAAIGRVNAADRLTETENRYRALIEQLPTATYMVSASVPRTTMYMSPQIERILGYAPEEWTIDLWQRSIHPNDAPRVLAEDARTDASGERYAVEYRLKARDGHWVWVHDEAQLILDARGKPAYWQGVRADITERKEAEHHLREAEQRYRGLIESMPAITYIDAVDPTMRTLYVSPQVLQITGFTTEEWIEDAALWPSRVADEDLPWLLAAIERHNIDGSPYDAEYRFRHKDGHWIWLKDSAIVLRDESGSPLVSQGVIFDITERKAAEEQLREAEERYRAIVEHVPAVIYVDAADDSMRTVYISPQVFDLTGYTPEEWMADPELWLKSAHVDDRESIADTYRHSIAADEPWSADYRLITRDGRTIWVHDETTTIRDASGTPQFLQGVIFDVTERKLAEQALRDSELREREAAERLRALDEMKNTFLAAVSHELRSPLTSILGLSLTLERTRELPDADRNDLLERLSSNARKLDRLLKDLLDIDRLSRGIVEPQYRLTDVGALSRRVIESLDALADRAVRIDVEPVTISVDPAKVERIVENLVINAVRHTASDRTIWLRVSGDGDGALICVEDDGVGVPEDLRDAIFEPFRQGPTASPHAPGTGIGLSLVARFAELHGGRAWVEERPGGGASFKVLLPAYRDDLSFEDPEPVTGGGGPEASATRG